MFDTVAARRMMVDGQIRTADVTDLDLIGAMLAIPRERFVPAAIAAQAYVDTDLPLGEGRALLKPMVLAKLIQAMRIRKTDHVLDVACGTGYSSAVLARLAGSVVALEQNEALAGQAKQAFATTEGSIVGAVGPLSAGWPSAAPYDLILLNGATEIVPEALGRQLKPDGPAHRRAIGRPSGLRRCGAASTRLRGNSSLQFLTRNFGAYPAVY
jgi:protein-L-isoaspartate(D-aspartate) O-methyltransferase